MRWMGDQAMAAARRGGLAGLLGAAQLVAQASLMNVPRDSGELAASVSVQADGMSARVSFGAPHALPVHEGTKHMAGRPFLKGALEACADAALARIGSEITL